MALPCSIPVIDLQAFPNQLPELVAACEDWGCFRLINYQKILPQMLMSEMKTVVKSLFDLPLEIKLRNTEVIPGTGYMALSEKNTVCEAFGVYDMASPHDVENFCSQLDASPHQRETIMGYAGAVHELLTGVGEKLAEGLGVESSKVGFEKWPCQFRINKYHFIPESLGSTGLQIHTDSGFLTVLQDDESVGGLEVMDKSGKFISVDPWPDTLIVNLGDMATVWSNGRLRNVKHRVQCKEATIRMSIASFLLGPKEAAMELPPELTNAAHPRVYVPFTFEDYRKLRFSTNMHAGEALALLHLN